jgi:hypothetical protein
MPWFRSEVWIFAGVTVLGCVLVYLARRRGKRIRTSILEQLEPATVLCGFDLAKCSSGRVPYWTVGYHLSRLEKAGLIGKFRLDSRSNSRTVIVYRILPKGLEQLYAGVQAVSVPVTSATEVRHA